MLTSIKRIYVLHVRNFNQDTNYQLWASFHMWRKAWVAYFLNHDRSSSWNIIIMMLLTFFVWFHQILFLFPWSQTHLLHLLFNWYKTYLSKKAAEKSTSKRNFIRNISNQAIIPCYFKKVAAKASTDLCFRKIGMKMLVPTKIWSKEIDFNYFFLLQPNNGITATRQTL